jgi:hypothetical protein
MVNNRLTRHSEDTTMTDTTLTRLRRLILMESNRMTRMIPITIILNLNTNPTIRTSNITSLTHSVPRKFNQPHFPPPNHKICINNNNLRYSHRQTTSHRMSAIVLLTARHPLHVHSHSSAWIMRW